MGSSGGAVLGAAAVTLLVVMYGQWLYRTIRLHFQYEAVPRIFYHEGDRIVRPAFDVQKFDAIGPSKSRFQIHYAVAIIQ